MLRGTESEMTRIPPKEKYQKQRKTLWCWITTASLAWKAALELGGEDYCEESGSPGERGEPKDWLQVT